MRKQYQFYSSSDWEKERRPTWITMVWRGVMILLLFVLVLIASVFIRIKMEDQETEEVEMIEEFKRGA